MKKRIAFLFLMALCLGLCTIMTASAEALGSYGVNDKGSVVVSADIPKAADHSYYTEMVKEPMSSEKYPMVGIDEIDSKYFLPIASSECGSVDKVTINGAGVLIYTPKGYSDDDSSRYDVLFLSSANQLFAESFMFADHRKQVDGYSSRLTYREAEIPRLVFKDLYDALGYYDDIRIIIVALSGSLHYTYDQTNEIAAVQKYVAENYRTYAESSSDKDLCDARYHFGIAGISGGGGLAAQTGLSDYCDRFGYVACFDGSYAMKWDEKNMNPKSVDLFFGVRPTANSVYPVPPYSAENYERNIRTSHVYFEYRLGHDYMLAAVGVYHIMHHWFQ